MKLNHCYIKHTLFFFLPFLIISCGPDLPEEVAISYQQLPEKIDFNFHIRPLLSDRCFACHGPDENAREADLRLDLEEHAFKALSSGDGYALVKGRPNKSQALQRILSEEEDFVMPPPESNLTLTNREKAMIAKWIEQGAEWKNHWAFIPPELPSISKDTQDIHPIDFFVKEKLNQEGLDFNPEADRERLLRRVSMDLTGLPPSLEEIDAFIADNSPKAYEKVVDKLLETEAYGERMAMDWMDLSRYADSHGLHADGWRLMWPWRDWVIKSFNENMPYDQFVTWQLAGDLLPQANKEQKLATAFHRNHPMTAEGGVIDEEFRLGYVFDRTETTATAFLGLTMGCARCHDHKFDPFSQEEYYEMTAFFNNMKELGMTGDDGNYGPMLLLSDEETDQKIAELNEAIEAKEIELEKTKAELIKTSNFIKNLPSNFQPKGLIGDYPFEKFAEKKRKNGRDYLEIDNNKNCTSPGKPLVVEGKIGKALQFEGTYDEVYLSEIGTFEMTEPFSAGAWINTTKRNPEKTQVIFGNAGEKNNFWRGWDFYLDTANYLCARLIHCLPHNYIHVRSVDSIAVNQWNNVFFTYDGSGEADGLNLFVNGKKIKSTIEYDHLYKSIEPVLGPNLKPANRALRVAKSYRAFTGEGGIFKGKIDEIKIYNRELMDFEVGIVAGLQDKVSDEELADLKARESKNFKNIFNELTGLRNQKLELMEPLDEIMVMEEMEEERPAFIYSRGEYDSPTKQVSYGTPRKVLPFSDELPKNRLGLAKWIFHEENPLTARVTVNRYWQLLFGKGLVNTPGDFGVQGALPSHPALLDWLAVSFRESGWDLKALHRLIVTSKTYKQSSTVSKEKRELDPENILLARGPSYRLSAEMIRDNALAASGLLVQKIGGESVRPYQPEGLWIDKGSFSYKLLRYKVTKGDSLYRRSLYTFVKRTSPHPAMVAFDAPTREVCTIQRESTNTPLQALILLNDPQFVEAARVLAQRMQLKGGEEIESKITYAFRLSTGRQPSLEEVALLKDYYQAQHKRLLKEPEAAQEILSVGEYPQDKSLDPTETAALAMVASTVLNHDEAYMKR